MLYRYDNCENEHVELCQTSVETPATTLVQEIDDLLFNILTLALITFGL